MRVRFLQVGLLGTVLAGLYIAARILMKDDEPRRLQSSVYRLYVSAPRPDKALPVFKLVQGDIVTLAVRSDRSGEFDVHGYEKKVDLARDGEVILTFTADQVGVFPVHLHEPIDPSIPDGPVRHRQLATLDVQAR